VVYTGIIEAHRWAIDATEELDPVTQDLLIEQAGELEQRKRGEEPAPFGPKDFYIERGRLFAAPPHHASAGFAPHAGGQRGCRIRG
jgi:hypothetical protein